MTDTKAVGKKKTRGAKRSDKRPARTRYWTSGRLLRRKLLALVRAGHGVEQAWAIWTARGRRVKPSVELFPTPLHNRLTQIAKERSS